MSAQTTLSAKQIAQAETWGKATSLPLKLGTLVHDQNTKDILAFITTPEQRIAYAMSDQTSGRGSGAKDPFQAELHLNRLRVTGLPFPNVGMGQHNSRKVVLCKQGSDRCIQPAQEILDVNQVVAEFDMPALLRLSAPAGNFLLRIQNDIGQLEPEALVRLSDLQKRKRKEDH